MGAGVLPALEGPLRAAPWRGRWENGPRFEISAGIACIKSLEGAA
jgi:hypothetical protein